MARAVRRSHVGADGGTGRDDASDVRCVDASRAFLVASWTMREPDMRSSAFSCLKAGSCFPRRAAHPALPAVLPSGGSRVAPGRRKRTTSAAGIISACWRRVSAKKPNNCVILWSQSDGLRLPRLSLLGQECCRKGSGFFVSGAQARHKTQKSGMKDKQTCYKVRLMDAAAAGNRCKAAAAVPAKSSPRLPHWDPGRGPWHSCPCRRAPGRR